MQLGWGLKGHNKDTTCIGTKCNFMHKLEFAGDGFKLQRLKDLKIWSHVVNEAYIANVAYFPLKRHHLSENIIN